MLEVTLIGTGATMPMPERATAACAIQYKGRNILLDCGEGTQAAARRAGVSLVKIDAICLTHYHGDHIFGLPGLLQTMASQGRTQPVLLTGPAEEYEKTISLLLALAGPLPFEIIRRPIAGPADQQALWDGLRLETCPLEHRVPSVGYRFVLPRAGRFLPQQAQALGVPQSLWGSLQKGKPAAALDGSIVQSRQVMGPARAGLTVVYATDTGPCAHLPEFAKGADLLICDATYAGEEELDKAQLYGHSTFAQCGQLAAQAGVKQLWLTHYSGALTDPQSELYRAQKAFPKAQAGFDGKHLQLKFPAECASVTKK